MRIGGLTVRRLIYFIIIATCSFSICYGQTESDKNMGKQSSSTNRKSGKRPPSPLPGSQKAIIGDGVVPNSPPLADAGADINVPVETIVTLDGTRSVDPDLYGLIYNWTLVSKPAQSAADINSPSSPTPTLVVDKPGYYVIQLIVSDGIMESTPDTVVITAVDNPTKAP